MKNLKNTLTAITLTAVLGIGAVSANAGMISGDGSAKGTQEQCSVKDDSVLRKFTGFINSLTGINFFDTSCNTDKEIIKDGFKRGRVEMDGFRRG